VLGYREKEEEENGPPAEKTKNETTVG